MQPSLNEQEDLACERSSFGAKALIVLGIIALVAAAEFGADWLDPIRNFPSVWPRLY